MRIIPAEISVETSKGPFDETVEYIRKTFHKGELDAGEKEEIEAARIHSPFFPHVKFEAGSLGIHDAGFMK